MRKFAGLVKIDCVQVHGKLFPRLTTSPALAQTLSTVSTLHESASLTRTRPENHSLSPTTSPPKADSPVSINAP
ncbi:MAG: hypothetical protein IJR63_00640 [Synergistaceae bacterium]|nr:hypothetical protein [Synergistaceae bacterium]